MAVDGVAVPRFVRAFAALVDLRLLMNGALVPQHFRISGEYFVTDVAAQWVVVVGVGVRVVFVVVDAHAVFRSLVDIPNVFFRFHLIGTNCATHERQTERDE